MNDEQQLMWNTLSAKADELCHTWAQDIIKSKSTRSRHVKADKYLGLALDLFTVEEITWIMTTWLKQYQIPLFPAKLKNFDEFHNRCGGYIFSRFPQKNTNKLSV